MWNMNETEVVIFLNILQKGSMIPQKKELETALLYVAWSFYLGNVDQAMLLLSLISIVSHCNI